MKRTDTHVYFYGGIFSNWYGCQFKEPIYNNEFVNSEQIFMFFKAIFFCDTEIAMDILKEADPANVKQLGRLVKGFDPKIWSMVSYGYMVYANYLKYSQNEDLKMGLIDTGDRILVEASPVDGIWGIKLRYDDPLILDEKNWQGQNLLGKALMEVRKLL